MRQRPSYPPPQLTLQERGSRGKFFNASRGNGLSLGGRFLPAAKPSGPRTLGVVLVVERGAVCLSSSTFPYSGSKNSLKWDLHRNPASFSLFFTWLHEFPLGWDPVCFTFQIFCLQDFTSKWDPATLILLLPQISRILYIPKVFEQSLFLF